MKKYNLMLLLVIVGIFSITLVSAVNECGNDNTFYGKFKVNQTVYPRQICETCTFVNLSSVTSPNGTTMIYNTAMSQNGINYNSTFTLTNSLGCYSYTVYGDKDGVLESETFDFLVTPTGLTDLLGFYWIVLALSAGLIVFGFWIKEGVFAILGSFGLLFLAVYTILYGIAGVKDMVVTWAVALILFGVGSYISIRAGIEMVQE